MDSLNLEVLNIERLKEAFDDIDFDINLPLIIGLSAGLGVLFLILLVLTVYYSFFNNGTSSIFLGSNFNIPGEFDDEEALLNDERTFLSKFTDLERQNYLDGKNYQLAIPPITNPLGTTLTESEKTYIKDRGIQAYIYEQPLDMMKFDDLHHPTVAIEDKLDVRFINEPDDEPSSVILNYPLPINGVNDANNDTVYFEVKIYEIGEFSKVSIGLSSKPYPLFRLPGYNKYSIAYESDGTVRINQPFYSPSIWNKLQEGDVVGVGFKPKSGTIFFTHNGKKILEAAHNVKFDLYPVIGSIGPAKLDTNIGQLGFVFIEANVKKWGFGSVYGTIGVPPAYGKEIDEDEVLDKGEELPPNYPSEEETFFGPSALLVRSSTNTESRPTKKINNPPSYSDEPKEPLTVEDDFKNLNEITEELYERRSSTFDLQNNNNTTIKSTPGEPMIINIPSPLIENENNDSSPSQSKDITQGKTNDQTAEDADEEETSPEVTPEPQVIPESGVGSSSRSPSNSKSKNKNKKKKKGKKKGKK